MDSIEEEFSVAIKRLKLSSEKSENGKKEIDVPCKKLSEKECLKLDTRILKLKKMLSSRNTLDQNRALIVLGNMMKQSNTFPKGKANNALAYVMRADIVSFLYAESNFGNSALARPMLECVHQLIASAYLAQQNNASATLDFLLRWINIGASVKAGKGPRCALKLLTRMMDRLSTPPRDFHHLVGAVAVGRVLDTLAVVMQKPKGYGGWEVQLCAGSALAALLSPHALGAALDVAMVRLVSAAHGACLVQLSSALRPVPSASAGVADEDIGHRAMAVMAQLGQAAISTHEAMEQSVKESPSLETAGSLKAISLYRETTLATVLENFTLVCAPYVSTVAINEEKLSMYEQYLGCTLAIFQCPALATNYVALAHSLTFAGHLQFLALLSGYWNENPKAKRIHPLINSVLGHLLAALAADTFGGNMLRDLLLEGVKHLPTCPMLWFKSLAQPYASDAFMHAVLSFAYFCCLLDKGAVSCAPALFPALVAMLNQRYSGAHYTAPSLLLTKLIWFTFAFLPVTSVLRQACRPVKAAAPAAGNRVAHIAGTRAAEAATNRAAENLVALLGRVWLPAAFTPHPAMLRWACCPRVPTNIRQKVILAWLQVDGADEFEMLELATMLANPLAADAMLNVITMASAGDATERGLEAMALVLHRWPKGALAAALRVHMPKLLDKLLTPDSTMDALDASALVALATGPLSCCHDRQPALATASSLSAMLSRATYACAVPPQLYASALWLAVALLGHTPDVLAALASCPETVAAVERAAASTDAALCEAAFRLLARVAAAPLAVEAGWSVSVQGRHVLMAMGSIRPPLVLAAMQMLYVLLAAEPRSQGSLAAVDLVRPESFLRLLASRATIVCFKFKLSSPAASTCGWQLMGRVMDAASREGVKEAESAATAPWVILAMQHCRMAKQMLLAVDRWTRAFRIEKQLTPSQRGLDSRWKILAVLVSRLVKEEFPEKLWPLVVTTIQGILDRQPGLDAHSFGLLRKRIVALSPV